MRATDLAWALCGYGEVTILCSHPSDLPDCPFSILSAAENDIDALLTACDAVLVFDMGRPELLRRAIALERFIIVENSAPIEHLEYNPDLAPNARALAYRPYVEGFAAQLIAGDHFLARSAIERRTVITNLCLAGRLTPSDITESRTLAHLVSFAPIGFARRCDRRATAPVDPSLLLWTGGVWDYMAPEAALAPFAAGARIVPEDFRLGFLYPPAPGQSLRAAPLFAALAQSHPGSWVAIPPPDHLTRGVSIESARALISLGLPGVENDTCVRLRLRDALLYRRPIIVDSFGATGDYVASTGIGVLTRSLAAEDVAVAMRALVESDALWAECQRAIEAERSRCILDDTLLGLVRLGTNRRWRPLRTAADKFAGLEGVIRPSSPFSQPFDI